MIETTRYPESVREAAVYVSFELGAKLWKLAFASSPADKPWVQTVTSGDLRAVAERIARARRRFGVVAGAPVISCYEAGRDGFWIHHALTGLGLRNRVVDSASIDVKRRARRSKTDRLDAVKLVMMLMRVCGGEPEVWREVRVPAPADEAQRHVSRERQQLVRDATRVTNQLRSLLATVGSHLPRRRRGEWWATVRDWSGAVVAAPLQQRLAHAEARLQLLQEQIATLDQQQRSAVASAPEASGMARLRRVKGLGATTVTVLVDEGLLWREFRNRRQVGGCLGFRPVPYQSGDAARDVGIDRAGNRRWRASLVQLAWNWRRWQPASALTHWYERRFGGGSRRVRRIGIVALARKLLIALWRYATTGVVPEGVVLNID